MQIEEKRRLTAFISYAHEDESARRRLERQLAPLQGEGLLEEWHDRLIQPGVDWEGAIHNNLDSADVILLLVSPDFLSSDYCCGVETTRAMQKHEMTTARVIPIILRASQWQHTPIGKLQALPTGAVPVNEWSDIDAAYNDIANGIRSACIDILDTPGNPGNPYRRSSVGDWSECEGTTLLKPWNRTIVYNSRTEVVSKSSDAIVVRVRTSSPEFNDDRLVTLPLDKPAQDSFPQFLKNVGETFGEDMPKNLQFQSKITGAGAEKLFIGEHVYYTTWKSVNSTATAGAEQLEFTGKTWLCPDVPLDGIVKFEVDSPVAYQSVIVVDYGRAAVSYKSKAAGYWTST